MYLVLIRPFENGLIMQQLLYADEIKTFDEVPVGDADVKESELKLATQLIDQIATRRVQARAVRGRSEASDTSRRSSARSRARRSRPRRTPKPRAQVIDLMEALKASLAGKGKAGAEGESVADSPRKAPKPAPRSSEAKPAKSGLRAVGGKGRG